MAARRLKVIWQSKADLCLNVIPPSTSGPHKRAASDEVRYTRAMTDTPPIPTSDHPPIFPALYAIKRLLIAAGLILCGLAVGGELLLMLLGYPVGLLLIFILLLTLPLLLGIALNPPLSVTPNGLDVRPMFGPVCVVRWESITALRSHPLLPVDRAGERLLLGHQRVPEQSDGLLLIVPGGDLPCLFRLVGWLSGEGLTPTLGISDITHRDYAALKQAVLTGTGLMPPESRA